MIADQRFPLVAVVPLTGTPGEGALYPALQPGPSGLARTSYAHTPAWVATYRDHAESVGHDVTYLMANDRPSLVWLANQAAIELHSWLARRDTPDEPDTPPLSSFARG